MRPIERGAAPCAYGDYKEAKQDLVNRLGTYCSYCERRIATILAVEHIQAKSLPHYAHLANDWNNFLLACVNCNSSKSAAEVDPARYLLPDRVLKKTKIFFRVLLPIFNDILTALVGRCYL